MKAGEKRRMSISFFRRFHRNDQEASLLGEALNRLLQPSNFSRIPLSVSRHFQKKFFRREPGELDGS